MKEAQDLKRVGLLQVSPYKKKEKKLKKVLNF
jgi:hypothetical protein